MRYPDNVNKELANAEQAGERSKELVQVGFDGQVRFCYH